MPSVFRLGYVDLATPDLDAATAYYRDVVGAVAVETAGDGAFLSVGLDHHTVALQRAERASIRAVGLQLGLGISIEDVADLLAKRGIKGTLKTDARPGVPRLLEIADVGGHNFELFPDIEASGLGFSREGVSPLKLGHVALISPDAPAVVKFLTEGLGFWFTDRFEEVATFVTCNRDHHVLNVIHAPFVTMHHLAFQLTDYSHQARAADLLAAEERPVLWGPSRHTAGHNIASYHYGADGALIEFYNDLDVYLPELDICEPRPWHGDRPQRPKNWPVTQLSRWETRFEFDMMMVTFGMPDPA